MPNRLKDMKIREISAVDKAANLRNFLIVKSEGGETELGKIDETVLALEVATEALGIALGSSMEDGVEIGKAAEEMADSFEEFATFVKAATNGSFKENMVAREVRNELWDGIMELENSVGGILANKEMDAAAKKAAIDENLNAFTEWFKQKIQGLSEVKKAGAKISGERATKIKAAYDILGAIMAETEGSGKVEKEDNAMKIEDITDAVAKAIAPLSERLEALEKGDTVEKKDEGQPNELADAIKKAVEEATQPLMTRLETLEKSKGIRKSADGQDESGSNKGSFWGGVL